MVLLFLIAFTIFGCSSNNNGTVTVLPLAPTNLSGSVISTTQINLSWIDNATNEDGYKIERKTGTGNYAVVGSTGSNMTTFSDLGLTPSTSYTYRVYAYNSAGNSIQYSNELTLSTQDSIPSWLTNGLVGYWPFNGNANDESGNGNNGTVNGATLNIDRFGNSNKAYSFNGINDYISTNFSGVIGTAERSVSFWAKQSQTNTTSNNQIVLGWGGNTCGPTGIASGFYCAFNIGNSNSSTPIGISIDANESAATYNTTYSVGDNNWHHYVYIKPSGSTTTSDIKIYQDGILLTQASYTYISTGIINTTSQTNLTFGRRTFSCASDRFYQGSTDDIRIYNRALSASEVAYLAAH